jgi:formate C-acetyltransferase
MTIDVRQFVYDNITPYAGDASFLQGPTEKTTTLREKVKLLLQQEREKN